MGENDRTAGAAVERYRVTAQQWPPVWWWLGVAATVICGAAAFYATDWLLSLIWPGTRDGLLAAVFFAVFWAVVLAFTLIRAHREGGGTAYVVSEGHLRYERGPVTRGVACERVTDLMLDRGSGWRLWRGYAPSLRVTTDDGETVTFPPIALWTRARREVVQRDLRRACGLVDEP